MKKKNGAGVIRLLSVAGLMAMAVSVSAETLEEVLQKNLEAVGGEEALKNVETLKRTGEMYMDGQFGIMDGTAEQIVIHGEKAFSAFDLAIFAQSQGWNGEIGWQDNTMSGITELEGQELDQIKSQVNVSYLADRYMNEDIEGLQLLDDETIEETEYYVVLDEDAGTTGAKFYLDKSDNLHKRTELTQNNPQFGPVDIVVTQSEYQEFEGVKLPTKNKIEVGDFVMLETTYTDTQINAEVDESVFKKPEPPQPVAVGGATTDTETTPTEGGGEAGADAGAEAEGEAGAEADPHAGHESH